MITVAELIKQLQELPPNSPVILSEDEEGNHYRPINGATDDDAYWMEKDRELDDVPYNGGVPCVVIW